MKELLALVPAALEIVNAIKAGDADKAALKTKALGQAIALKQATRAAAKGAKKALGK